MTRWKQPPSYCEDCGQEFKKYKSLERHHENSVCGGRDSKFPCKYTGCTKAYSRKGAADKHYREAHLGQFSPCRSRQRCEHPGCGKTFSRSENLREHHRTQHSSQILEIHCQHPECGRTFKSSDGLKYHQQSSHSNQKPQFPCKHPGCEKVFTQSSGAEYHYRTEHSAQQPSFPCDFPGCGRVSKTAKNLKIHQKLHRSNPKVECDFPGCKRTFRNRHGQRQHYDTIHMSVKSARPKQVRIVCGHLGCKKSFANESNLRVHAQKKHLPYKNSRCQYCEWESPNRRTYLIHLLRAHDQRNLLVLPPQPSMEISKSTIIHQLGSAKALNRAATTKEDLKQTIMVENQAQSLYSPNLDSRVRNLGDVTTLTVRERNDIACKSLSSLKAYRPY
jgi:hypothetical protein